MNYNIFITPHLLDHLGSQDTCEIRLQEAFQNILWNDTLDDNREWGLRVKRTETCTVEVELELNLRSAEIVKDMMHEALIKLLDPDYDSDIEFDALEECEGDYEYLGEHYLGDCLGDLDG